MENHGEACKTWKLANAFQIDLKTIEDKYAGKTYFEEPDMDGERQDREDDFLQNLLSEYAKMLQTDCYFLQEDEQLIETFTANSYTFEESGKMNNS